jgi:hypothetical protein
MKLLPGFIFTLLFLFLIGCGEKKEEKAPANANENHTVDTSDISTSPLQNPNESFHMRYNFALNKEYKYSITTSTENTQTMKTDTTISQHATQDITYLINIKPIKINKDSTTEFVCTFYSIKVEANVKNHKFKYQSGVTTDSLSKARFAEYEASANSPFNIKVSNTGEVTDISKTDKILTEFLNLKNVPDTINSDQKNRINEQIIQTGIKPLISQIFRKIPKKLMAKDSVWTYQQPPSKLLVFKVNSTNIYKVNSLGNYNNDKVAVINASLDTKITGDNRVTERGFTYQFDKPITEASGKIYFNVDKGYVQKSKVKTKLTIHYTMESKAAGGRGNGSRSEVVENTNIVELL